MKKHSPLVGLTELKLFLALGLVLGVFLFISLAADAKHGRGSNIPEKVTVASPFQGVAVTAKAAYVYDVSKKEVLYAKAADERLPLASLTKVMSALVASDIAGPDTIVTISRESLMTDGDSGLLVGERWKMKDLLDFSLISSSNDGIHAAALAAGAIASQSTDPATAEATFVSEMNAKADEIQMKNTYYFNPTGLDESTVKGGAYGSAHDMAKLFEYILSTHPDLLEATQEARTSISSLDKSHAAKNTDILANLIPGLVASKTGYTDIAGGNLVIAFNPELDHLIIISVLGSTEQGRFDDMTRLVNATLTQISTDDHPAGK